MSSVELLYGERDATTLAVSERPLDLEQRDTVTIAGAEIVYCLYEIPMAIARRLLPKSLHPSIPALMGITLIHADDGPLGAFDLAYVGIACRTGIKPRHLIVSAFCNAANAADFFQSRYGFACRNAEIKCGESFDRVHGQVAVDGTTILDLTITHCIPLLGSGALIKYSPPLNAVTRPEGPVLAQFEAGYDFKRVLRGEPRCVSYRAADLGDALLQPTQPISGSHATVDLQLLPVRFGVDLSVPAESGGAKKIT